MLQWSVVKIAASVLAVAATLLAAGCGSSSKSSSPPPAPTTTAAPTTSGSSGTGKASSRVGPGMAAPEQVQHKLAKGLLLVGAKLSHTQAVIVPEQHDLYFVSARVSGMDRKDAVATWMVSGLGGSGPAYAVDAAAALDSQYAGAMGKYPDITIDAPG